MSTDKNKQVLEKIIRYIDHSMEYCSGIDFDHFTSNRMLQEACVFNVLQIGELSKSCLNEDFTKAHPEIPWKQMYGMRNRLVHDYDGIRLYTVWETITNDFPVLKEQLLSILNP